jgi:dUTP pyrophosphatase
MINVLDDKCTPERATKYSACVDLRASVCANVDYGDTVVIPLGVSLGAISEELKANHYFKLEPRSSLRARGILAGSGIIDCDYKDEIKIILHNLSGGGYYIDKGDKIAQLMLCEHKTNLMGIESETERTGGLGSSGN